jgi:hypothetical protein
MAGDNPAIIPERSREFDFYPREIRVCFRAGQSINRWLLPGKPQQSGVISR